MYYNPDATFQQHRNFKAKAAHNLDVAIGLRFLRFFGRWGSFVMVMSSHDNLSATEHYETSGTIIMLVVLVMVLNTIRRFTAHEWWNYFTIALSSLVILFTALSSVPNSFKIIVTLFLVCDFLFTSWVKKAIGNYRVSVNRVADYNYQPGALRVVADRVSLKKKYKQAGR